MIKSKDDIITNIMKNVEVQEMVLYFEHSFNTMLRDSFNWKLWDWNKKVKFKIIPELSFNARAVHGIPNIIGINLGALPLIQALSVNVSKLNFICDIPVHEEFDQDLAIKAVLDIFATCYVGIERHDLNLDYISSLFDEDSLGGRFDFSYSLYKKVLYFFVFHEYSHILCKHAALLQIKEYQEFESPINRDYNYTALVKQWSEMEADSWGSILMCETLKLYNSSKNESNLLIHGNMEDMEQIFISIGLLFLIFSYSTTNACTLEDFRNQNHPHPALRIAYTFDKLANYINQCYRWDMDIVIQIMENALSKLLTLSEILSIPFFTILQHDFKSVSDEISTIQEAAGIKWIEKSNNRMLYAIRHLRKETSFF